MKKWFGALAIALLALALSAPPAEAHSRCWWNGYAWVCKKKPRPYVRHWRPYRPHVYAPAYRYSYYRPRYRPYYVPRVYACVWPYC